MSKSCTACFAIHASHINQIFTKSRLRLIIVIRLAFLPVTGKVAASRGGRGVLFFLVLGRDVVRCSRGLSRTY